MAINLDIPPFSLGGHLIERAKETKLQDGECQRHVCLYEFRELQK